MPVEFVNQIIKWQPQAGAGTSVTPSASGFGNSSYVQLSAAIDGDIVLCALTFLPGITNVELEVDIAKGGSGSEVVITTFRTAVGNNGSAAALIMVPLPIPVSGIVNGNRIAARMRKTGTDVTAWKVSIGFYYKPMTGLTTTANSSLALPAAAAGAAITTGTVAWANTAYTQIRSAAGNALVIGSVSALLATNTELEVDIATGTAGLEVVITTVRFRFIASTPQTFTFKTPLNNVAANIRVAARTRHSSTTSATCNVSLMVYNSPI